MLFLLMISSASAAMLYRNIPLQQEEYYHGGEGSLTIRHSTSLSGRDRTYLLISLKDIPSDPDMKYQAWLVDDDSNYYNSLGMIRVSRSGRATFRFNEASFPLFQYDRLLITEEPASDFDLQPSNHIFSLDLPFRSDTAMMRTRLNGRNEIPKIRTSARGEGTFSVDTENNTLTFDITYKRLEDETAAYIQGFAGTDQEGDILFELPLGDHKTGAWYYPEEYESKILEGKTYVNVFTSEFPEGEIRGQIVLR